MQIHKRGQVLYLEKAIVLKMQGLVELSVLIAFFLVIQAYLQVLLSHFDVILLVLYAGLSFHATMKCE